MDSKAMSWFSHPFFSCIFKTDAATAAVLEHAEKGFIVQNPPHGWEQIKRFYGIYAVSEGSVIRPKGWSESQIATIKLDHPLNYKPNTDVTHITINE